MLLWKYNCFDEKFVSQWLMFWNRLKKKVRWQNWMAVNFSICEIYSNVERMGGCEYSIEIMIVSLKEGIAVTNVLWK